MRPALFHVRLAPHGVPPLYLDLGGGAGKLKFDSRDAPIFHRLRSHGHVVGRTK
jgi:hypothetical protein